MARKKSGMQPKIMNFGLAMLGGFVSEKMTDAVEEMPFMATNQQAVPWVTAGLGLAGLLFNVGGEAAAPAFYGWAGAAGTELGALLPIGGNSAGYIPNMTQQQDRYRAIQQLKQMPMMGVLR